MVLAGACPGWLPADLAAVVPGGGLALFVARLPCLWFTFLPPIPPPPSPVGKGEIFSFLMQGASPLASPRLSRKRHWCRGRTTCPAGACPGWLPADPAAVVPGGGRMNPNGTCSPCPGGEDHLKRRSSSPPVPPLLGWRHCSPKPHLNSHAPSGYRNATPRPSRKGQSPSPGTRLAGSASAARVQSRGCKGRSPLHEKNLGLPLPAGKGVGGISFPFGEGGQESKLKAGLAGGKESTPPAGRVVCPFTSAARVQSRGCKGRSPLHKIT